MSLFFSIAIFILGLAVGSFLNCVIYRMETGQSFLRGRSLCPHCKHQLGFWDLIPILSFVLLFGKCRYCQKRISIQYPLVELATGILFILTYDLWMSDIRGMSDILIFAVIPFLIAIFVYDLKHYIIPDKIVYPAILIAGIYNLVWLLGEDSPLQAWRGLSSPILSAIGAAGFFAAIVLISRGKWMGVGDIKLAFLMGLVLAWPNILVALFLAFFLGAIIGVGLIISGRKTMKSEVPLGPFLVIGTFIALFWGQKIIDWYLNFYEI